LITPVDGDDYFFPSKLKSELNVINNYSYNCVYSNHVFVDEFGDEISYFAKKKSTQQRVTCLLSILDINLESKKF